MRIRMAIPLLASLFMLVLVSACSQPGSGTTTGSGSSLTPLQVLQKSETAMQQLKSAHIDLKSSTSAQVSGMPTATATGTTGTTGTPTVGTGASNVTLNITGSGDEQLPDAEQLNLSLGQGVKLSEIVQGNNVYIQNTQGKWYVLNKSDLQGMAGSTFPGLNVNINQNDLIALLQHSKITDYGDQTLNGQSLRHISASLDKTGVQQLLQSNPQLGGSMSSQQLQALLNNTKSLQSSIDVWIDESQFYVHQTEIKLNLVANPGATSTTGTPTTGASTANISVNTDSVIDLSKFNESITITPPANATPTNDPTTIFSGAGMGGQ